MHERTYHMLRHTLVAPIIDNRGVFTDYVARIRQALLAERIDGWTEYRTNGYWRGKSEPGVTFEIFTTRPDLLPILCKLARDAMPDQEAIQITTDPAWTRVTEA